MSYKEPEQICLKGSLILADPSLADPGFERSVLLLTNHKHDDGAAGFILNKPMGKKVSDLIQIDAMRELGDLPVFLGGPVSSDQLTFASINWDAQDEELGFDTHLSSEEALHRLREGFFIRAFVGYSGWSEGQLEYELQQRAWITRKPVPIAASLDADEGLWRDLLSTMGPYYKMLASFPEHPELN
ncbi:MAG: YqgE/AlgH family protein [Verrucomicrobiales bacterium]|nr:YqgE/AlgH family protein [Verrucomicrobiales bacterium]